MDIERHQSLRRRCEAVRTGQTARRYRADGGLCYDTIARVNPVASSHGASAGRHQRRAGDHAGKALQQSLQLGNDAFSYLSSHGSLTSAMWISTNR